MKPMRTSKLRKSVSCDTMCGIAILLVLPIHGPVSASQDPVTDLLWAQSPNPDAPREELLDRCQDLRAALSQAAESPREGEALWRLAYFSRYAGEYRDAADACDILLSRPGLRGAPAPDQGLYETAVLSYLGAGREQDARQVWDDCIASLDVVEVTADCRALRSRLGGANVILKQWMLHFYRDGLPTVEAVGPHLDTIVASHLWEVAAACDPDNLCIRATLIDDTFMFLASHHERGDALLNMGSIDSSTAVADLVAAREKWPPGVKGMLLRVTAAPWPIHCTQQGISRYWQAVRLDRARVLLESETPGAFGEASLHALAAYQDVTELAEWPETAMYAASVWAGELLSLDFLDSAHLMALADSLLSIHEATRLNVVRHQGRPEIPEALRPIQRLERALVRTLGLPAPGLQVIEHDALEAALAHCRRMIHEIENRPES